MSKADNVDRVLRHLHRQLSRCKRDTPESTRITNLIGPLRRLYVLKPIDAIHEQRLHDMLARAMRHHEGALAVATDTTALRGQGEQ
jgi:hypothetical protein